MRFSPLARGCSSSTSRWEGTIWNKIRHFPGLSARSRAELKRRSHYVKLAFTWQRMVVQLCFDYTGARLDNKPLPMKDGHNRWHLFVYQGSSYRGVGFPASKGRFPQARLYCSSVGFPGRGEELHLDKRCIHLACGLPTMANVQSVDGLSGRLTSALCNPPGMYSMGNTFMTGNGCEAYNILRRFKPKQPIRDGKGLKSFL